MNASEAADTLEPGRVVGDRYRIVRLIGRGGMGAVYEVEHTVMGKHYALKQLLPALATRGDVVARFVREAKIAGNLDHPGIVQVTDAGSDTSGAFLVMEMLDGESFESRLERRPSLSDGAVCGHVREASLALSKAHAAGVVHRDLKPANLFLAKREGRVVTKVLDFGISKLSESDGEFKLTSTGAVMGTPFYMSPEQARGDSNIDLRSDVYSMGVVLYQALSGRLPFLGPNYNALIVSILSDSPPDLAMLRPELPQALVDVVARAMRRDRAERYDSAEDLANALEPFASLATLRPDDDALAGTVVGDARAVSAQQAIARRSGSDSRAGLVATDAAVVAPSRVESPERASSRGRNTVVAAVAVVALGGTLALGLRLGQRGTTVHAAQPADVTPTEPREPDVTAHAVPSTELNLRAGVQPAAADATAHAAADAAAALATVPDAAAVPSAPRPGGTVTARHSSPGTTGTLHGGDPHVHAGGTRQALPSTDAGARPHTPSGPAGMQIDHVDFNTAH